MSGTSGTETTQSESRTSELTNYESDGQPRRLTQTDVADASREDVDVGSRPYYAIKREDGYVGIAGNSPRHTKTPKIRVLYVTGDGTRSFILPYRAVEGEDGHEFKDGLTAIVARDPDDGFKTAARSVESFRDLADDLYGVPRGDGNE